MRLARWLAAIGLVFGALTIADVAATGAAESRLAAQAEASVAGSEATADISSFPFTGRLLLSGRVRRVTFDLAPVRFRQLEGAVRIELMGLQLDRDAMFGGDVQLERIDRGRLSVRFGPDALSRLVGRAIALTGGSATVDVAGRQIPARFEADRERLRILVPGIAAIEIEIARPDLVPCSPEVTVDGEAIVLACDFDEVPEALVSRAVG